MADSLSNSLSSIHSLGSSFGNGSRPSSRSQSEASFSTARPGSSSHPRGNISHEIDHIKTLISRSAESPRKPKERISAQVFRPRTTSISSISSIAHLDHAHIFHELDQLKRRIRQEQEQLLQAPQLTRRISQIDPGQESDSDHEGVLDEREVELEHAREDAIVVRQRLDGLLEIAERNVDNLTADKERLESLCEQRREGLVAAAVERRNLIKALDIAQTNIELLKDELQETVLEHQKQLSEVQARQIESDAVSDRLQEQLTLLQSHEVELETKLAATKNETNKFLEDMERLSAERSASDGLFKEEITKLQEKVDRDAAESQKRSAEIQELRSTLTRAEAARSQADGENTERREQLVGQIEQGKRLLQQALHDAAVQHAAHQEVIHSRDQLTSEVEQYQIKLGAALYQRERTEKQLSEARLEHEEQNRILVENHEKLVAELQSSVESIHARLRERDQSHASAVEELAKQHQEALHELKASHQLEIEQIRKEATHNAEKDRAILAEELATQHAAAIDALKSSHRVEMEQIRLDAERRTIEASENHARITQDMAARHAEALENQKTSHQDAVELLRAEATRTAEELTENHARAMGDLATQHTNALEGLKASHQAEVERTRAEAIRDSQEDHARAVSELHSQRREALNLANLESERRLEQLTNAHDEELAVLEAKISKLQSDHEESLATVRREHDAAILENSARSALERQTTQTEARSRVDELTVAHEATLAAMQERHAQGMAELTEDQIESVKAEEERRTLLQASHEAELAARHSQHEQLVAQLRADYASERDASNIEQKQSVLQLQEEHQNELTGECERAQKSIAEAEVAHRSALESVTAEHQSAISEVQADLHNTYKALESLKTSSAEERARAEFEHEQRVVKLESGWSKVAEDTLKAHKSDMQKAADEAARNLDAAIQRFQGQLAERDAAEVSRVVAFKDAHAQEILCIRDSAKTDVEAAHAELETTKEQLLAAHSGEVDRLRLGADARSEETRAGHELEVGALREKLEAAESTMKNAIEEHARLTTDLRNTQVAELQRLKTEHDRETNERETKSHAEMELLRKDSVEVLSRVSAIEAGYDAKIENLKLSYAAELTILKNEVAAYDEAIESKNEDVRGLKQEVENLQSRLEEARSEMEEREYVLQKQHRTARDASVERAHQSGQAELRNLKKRHQDAVSQVRATAQRQAAAQLTELEKLHQKELETFSQNASEAHQAELMRLEMDNRNKLAELENKLQEKHQLELSLKDAAYLSEMTALQARMDASLTGQAEAERTVALLRRQATKTHSRSPDSKASANDQVASLQKENEDLSKKLLILQSSLRDSQRKGGSSTSSPSRGHEHVELASLKLQLDNLEQERSAMRRTMEKRSAENLELVRQNGFLVKELEVILAQLSRNKKSASPTVDALVQTEALISELKVDLSSARLLKEQSLAGMRPTTPLSPGNRQAKDEIDMAWTTRSFEDYLQNAHAELSQLGSVISANETLFARKISEHVGELQKAKDKLAADYDSKIKGLAADKEKIEAMVLTKQQAAFAQDRKALVASYTEGSTDFKPTPRLPDRNAVALRNAEERLVADYNKRIVRRKSHIALKHAQEFQSLTRDYDRKVADLLDNRSQIEGDLSIDPTKFEQDIGELQTTSARLAERPSPAASQQHPEASPSPSPIEWALRPHSIRRRSPTDPAPEERSRPRTRTSTPRTSCSIPRSSSVPRAALSGDNNSGERAVSQSFRGAEKHPPVPQLSLMRGKTPSDVYASSGRAASSPLLGTTSPLLGATSPRLGTTSPLLGATSPRLGTTSPLINNAPSVKQPVTPQTLRRTSQRISPQPPPPSRGKSDKPKHLNIEPIPFEQQRPVHRQTSYIKGAVNPKVLEPSKLGFLRRVVDKISSPSSPPRPSSSSSAYSSSTRLGHRARQKSTRVSNGMI